MICFYLLLISSHLLNGQDKPDALLDSLFTVKPSKLQKAIYKIRKTDPETARIYTEAYLKRAKGYNHLPMLSNGYKLMALVESESFEKKIKYYDSAIYVSKNLNNKDYPTRLYISKGATLDAKGYFNDALNNYVKALQSANNHNDSVFMSIANHNIALLKRRLGKYEEAEVLFQGCLDYEGSKGFKTSNDSIGYLSTLAELVKTLIEKKDLDKAKDLNLKGVEMSKNLPNSSIITLNQGIISYYDKNYDLAIKNLRSSLQEFLYPNNNYFYENHYIIDSFFYLGKSYSKIGKKEESIRYYKKIDSLVEETSYFVPRIRSAYSAIIDYYKNTEDIKNQLYYINRLIFNDSILDYKFKNLDRKILSEYDTPLLLSEKQQIIKKLESKNNWSYSLLGFAIFIIVVIGIFLNINYRKKQKYKARFEEIIKTNQKKEETSNLTECVSIGIAENIVSNILEGLEKFEKENGYIEKSITANLLATQLKTNSKYLSKVIKHYKRKSFTSYINDLRISYIINKLKEEKKFRNYTIKAIAFEAGFNSAEVFSKSFFKKTGIYPSYFIKKLQIT